MRSCYTAIMYRIRKSFRLGALSLLTVLTVFSVGSGQLLQPRYFSMIGSQQSGILPFLRASVRLGDRYLMKNVFFDSILRQYPVVLDSYIQEDDLMRRLEEVEVRAPQSRDVLNALSILYERSGNTLKAEAYRQKVKTIDPTFDQSNMN